MIASHLFSAQHRIHSCCVDKFNFQLVDMLFKYVLLLTFSSFFGIKPLTACSCIKDIASQVFIGSVINVTDDIDEMIRKVVFRVEENFKGALPSNGLIDIFTHMMESACGLQINKGEKWQIWAHRTNMVLNQLDAS